MKKLIPLLMLCAANAIAGPPFIDMMRPQIPRLMIQRPELSQAFAACDVDRALPTDPLQSLGVRFLQGGAGQGNEAESKMRLTPLQQVGGQGADEKLALAAYGLSAQVVLARGISVVGVGQAVKVGEKETQVGVRYTFVGSATRAMAAIHAVGGAAPAGVTESIDADDRSAWCWRHLAQSK